MAKKTKPLQKNEETLRRAYDIVYKSMNKEQRKKYNRPKPKKAVVFTNRLT